MIVLPAAAVAAFTRDRVLDSCASLKQELRDLSEEGGRIATGVHDIRKLAKAVRGGFALFRLEKLSGREIQAIGRLLSGTRDAVSRKATWERLEWQEDARVAKAIGSLLVQQSHAVSRPPPPMEAVLWCLDRVDAAQRNLRQLPMESLAESFRRGLGRLERRVCQRCRLLECGVDSGFHEARKALKAWMGALGYLPEGLRQDQPSLDDLAEWLGDENDLAVLSGWLEKHGFTEHFAPGLWKMVRKRRRRLQRKVIGHLPPPKAMKLPPP